MVRKSIRIRGPVDAGKRVPRLNASGNLRGDLRWFNPKGEAFDAEVPNVDYYVRLIRDGSVEEIPEAKPAPVVKRGDK
jgi:hypothetical protein